MKKLTVLIGFFVVLATGSGLYAQTTPDESLFREAKLLVYDKSWSAALIKLDDLREKFPDSPYAGQALFYKGECLSGLGGRERDALRAYKDYIRLADAKPSLVEESEGSIIDLAFGLFENGDAPAIGDIERRLGHDNKVVRYYAAYKLSLVPDKKAAAKAAPVLMKIVENEKDPELLDRARIALLRVSPESLKTVEDRKPATGAPRMLKIRVWNKGQKEPAFSLNIPWALADLALSAMDDDDRAAIGTKVDLNEIVDKLAKSKEKIIRIVGDDGSIIEIWIE